MGSSMCGHLIKAGYTAHIYNRTQSKTEELAAMGAVVHNTPAEVARNSSIIFTIVGFPADVEEVYFGENGILNGAPSESTVVDMTTSNPSLAKRIYSAAAEQNIAALDAPVSGGDIGARNATLAIMVGGDTPAFNKIFPLFECMGQNIKLMGRAGSGQHTKMANQILIAGTMIGTVESLLYAYKAGLDLDETIDVIGSGAAGSWSINNLGRRIAKDDFAPGFYIKHFVKDMGIALAEAKAMNLSLPGLALVQQFYIAAQAQGLESEGTQALYQVLASMNGI